ncbi:homoserine/homoserine lactone efflux protein [Azotobacter beijerinckii]|uniref:Homoserine/homoserine lactone efflux protein n=1 Tax=Azotobacter beijerinckii TaxID=170623 RepID=A0A1H9HSP8_9GAMM|nr:LysE family transporter [Azotobacter beijerinckii]SEQ65286.1 homoserine/homoserine lactone efflux protein [Azotobacter beijerinckii]
MAPETWLAYFAACWVISLSPGAGAIASMSSGLSHGFRRGYWNAVGLQLALAVQIAIVAAGLGALLATSELAFGLIKWFGVAYLAYLGWKQWRAPLDEPAAEGAPRPLERPLALVLRGFLVNAGNPKAIVFILAVLPQFLDPARPLLAQYLLMAATMIGVDLLVMAGYTGLAAKVLPLLRSPRQLRLLNRTFAALFVAAAGLLALVRRAV